MRITSCLILLALAACAGNPKPGESGYPYNLSGPYQAEFLVDGTPYRGGMELATASGGVLSGEFTVTEPEPVIGTVEGTIVADSVAFAMPYEIQESGCAGVVRGRAPIAAGGTGFAGPIELEDECAGELSGTITVTR